MNEINVVLFSAENNMKFVTLLENCLIKLENRIRKKTYSHSLLFHTTPNNSIFLLDLIQNKILVTLGEIQYSVDIKRIYTELSTKVDNDDIEENDVENILLSELKKVVDNYFILKDSTS